MCFLENEEAMRARQNINPKEVVHKTKIRHKEPFTWMSLTKGNVLKVISCNDNGINI
jgi:hypothetical protein